MTSCLHKALSLFCCLIFSYTMVNGVKYLSKIPLCTNLVTSLDGVNAIRPFYKNIKVPTQDMSSERAGQASNTEVVLEKEKCLVSYDRSIGNRQYIAKQHTRQSHPRLLENRVMNLLFKSSFNTIYIYKY